MVAMKQEKIGTRNGASTVHDVMVLAMDLTDVRSSVRGQGRYVPTGCVGYDQRAKGVFLQIGVHSMGTIFQQHRRLVSSGNCVVGSAAFFLVIWS